MRRLKLILFLITSGIAQLCYADDFVICDQIVIKDGRMELNGNEKVLVCGSESGPKGWKDIPFTQIELHLKYILQNSGYLNPRFERESQRLLVWRGPLTKIKSFQILGADEVLDRSKKRKVIDTPMTPGKLNEIESWANQKIRSRGYPCPDIQLEARGWNGEVVLQTNLGTRRNFGKYTTEGLDGLNSDILKRYQPFDPDDVYDIRKTQIMTERILNDALFQSAFFETHCASDDFHLQLKTLVGPPKILRFGFGASTEELPFLDLSYRDARLDDQASSVTTSVHASPILQSLSADSEFYWFRGWHRTYLAPRLNLRREIESAYQTDSTRTGFDVGVKWDDWNTRFLARGGPSLNTVKTIRGIGPTLTYPTIEGSLILMSHAYEASLRDQYEGWNSSFSVRAQKKGIGSELDVSRLDLNSKFLWNLGNNYFPPLLVLGTRLQGITVVTGEEKSLDLIPIDDRIFVGGDQNLRGFGRKSINNSGFGYLSFLYVGFELRLIEELPYHVEPFILWDIGKTGTKGNSLDSAVLSSEGLGARWRSPFGTFRGSYARGRVFQKPENFGDSEQRVFFLSFGQEF